MGDSGIGIEITHRYMDLAKDDSKEIEKLSNKVATCPYKCPAGSRCIGGSCIFHRPADGGLDQDARNVKPLGVQDSGIGIEITHRYMDIAKDDAKEIEKLSNEVAVCLHECPPGSFCLVNQCIFHRPADGGLDQDARNDKPLGVQDSGVGIEISHRYMDIAKDDAKEIEKLSNEVAVCLHDCPWGSFCLGNQCIFHRPADGGLDQEAQNAKPRGVQDYGIGIELSHHYMDMAKEDAKEIEQLSTEVPPCLTHCPPPGYCVGLECIFQSPTDGGHEHVAQSVKLRGVQDYGIGIEPPHHYMDIAKEDAKEIEAISGHNEPITDFTGQQLDIDMVRRVQMMRPIALKFDIPWGIRGYTRDFDTPTDVVAFLKPANSSSNPMYASRPELANRQVDVLSTKDVAWEKVFLSCHVHIDPPICHVPLLTQSFYQAEVRDLQDGIVKQVLFAQHPKNVSCRWNCDAMTHMVEYALVEPDLENDLRSNPQFLV